MKRRALVLPDELDHALKLMAEREYRSVHGQIIHILTKAVPVSRHREEALQERRQESRSWDREAGYWSAAERLIWYAIAMLQETIEEVE